MKLHIPAFTTEYRGNGPACGAVEPTNTEWERKQTNVYPDAAEMLCEECEKAYEVAGMNIPMSHKQFSTVMLAYEMGYFELGGDEGCTLEDVADEIGLSHQATSERIRKGLSKLLGEISERRGDIEMDVE